MEYIEAVAYVPGTSVVFKMKDGRYTLVSVISDEVEVSPWIETFTKWDGIAVCQPPVEQLKEAEHILENATGFTYDYGDAAKRFKNAEQKSV